MVSIILTLLLIGLVFSVIVLLFVFILSKWLLGNIKISNEKKLKFSFSIIGGISTIIVGIFFPLQEIVMRNYDQFDSRYRDAITLLMSGDATAELLAVHSLHQIAIDASKTITRKGYTNKIENFLNSLIEKHVFDSSDNDSIVQPFLITAIENIIYEPPFNSHYTPKPNRRRIRANSLISKGDFHFENSNYREAEVSYKKALKKLKKLDAKDPTSLYQKDIASTLFLLGKSHFYASNYPKAEASFNETLQIFAKRYYGYFNFYNHEISVTLFYLGKVHYYSKNYSEAEQFFDNALQKFRGFSEEYYPAYFLEIPLTLFYLGKVYYDTNRYPEAEAFFNESLQLVRNTANENPYIYPYLQSLEQDLLEVVESQ